MKKCPQCNSVYTFETAYCLNDGATLIEEKFFLPSEFSTDEEETVIKSQPINFPPKTIAETSVKSGSNLKKYTVFLFVGLFLGGTLVLGILVLIFSQLRSSNSEKPLENVHIASGKHNERNKTRKDSEFNGFVLSENANIRSAPNSAVLDALPQNDRLDIQERDGTWYRVICEHGVSGWMHGNMIRFDDDEVPF